MEDKQLILEDLLSNFRNDLNNNTIVQIGKIVDLSYDCKNIEGLEFAISEAEKIFADGNSKDEISFLHYIVGNAWSNLTIIDHLNGKISTALNDERLEKQLLHLRLAVHYYDSSDKKIKDDFICRVLTNLGSLLDYIGRYSEAISLWDRALEFCPKFGMAKANKGICLENYPVILNDSYTKLEFLSTAKDNYSESLKAYLDNSFSKEELKNKIEAVDKNIKILEKKRKNNSTKEDSNPEERRFRNWALKEKLFLNPLNDIKYDYSISEDVITLPPIVMKVGESPYFHSFYDHLKQEFSTARYFCYLGQINNKYETHFVDKKMHQSNSLDHLLLSRNIEYVKSSFRIAYSIFDKIAFMLNRYYDLGIPDKNVSFKSFWFVNVRKDKTIRTELIKNYNHPLRGLFWLSKDLFEDNETFKESIEPDAKLLNEIRNFIEHKHLKVHEDFYINDYPRELKEMFKDKLAYSISRSDLETKTMKILKIARAALIYLSHAILVEENYRSKLRDKNVLAPPMFIEPLNEFWKK
jgi:tetratricopeptide (TPR) repeat protein